MMRAHRICGAVRSADDAAPSATALAQTPPATTPATAGADADADGRKATTPQGRQGRARSVGGAQRSVHAAEPAADDEGERWARCRARRRRTACWSSRCRAIRSPSVDVTLALRLPDTAEPLDKTGLAQFVASMLRKGTRQAHRRSDLGRHRLRRRQPRRAGGGRRHLHVVPRALARSGALPRPRRATWR